VGGAPPRPGVAPPLHKVFDIIFGLIKRGLFGGWSRASRANVVSPLGLDHDS